MSKNVAQMEVDLAFFLTFEPGRARGRAEVSRGRMDAPRTDLGWGKCRGLLAADDLEGSWI